MIKKISPDRKSLKKFTQFQIDLYKGNDCYVPPLLTDDIDTLDPKVTSVTQPISWLTVTVNP